MSMEETNAFSALNQLMIQQNMVSPTKQPEAIHPDKWMQMLMQLSQPTPQNLPQMAQFAQLPPMQQIPQMPQIPQIPQIPQNPVVVQTSSGHESQGDQTLKASPSASSEMSRDSGAASPEQYMNVSMGKPLQSIDSQANIAANESKPAHETWMECFNTTKAAEYEALLFSVYVTERTTQKLDGYTHFDCLHRLQSKCRYRVRAKTQDEFFIVEEKGVHNHGAVEPVGQAGSHAGLPKTIREIVDRAYNDGWPVEMRTAKVDEEIKRLGLPANPRLGRQIDNRIAYLRRVKNLSESRRMQDQVNVGVPLPSTQAPSSPTIDPTLFTPQMLQALMEQNGGSLTVEKDIVEKLLGSQAVAELAAAQQETITPPQTVENVVPEVVKNEELPLPMNQDFLEFIQQQKLNHDNEQALLAAQHAAMAMVGGHENM